MKKVYALLLPGLFLIAWTCSVAAADACGGRAQC